MWRKVKSLLLFQTKRIQFAYRTWKSRREISKAYGKASPPRPSPPRVSLPRPSLPRPHLPWPSARHVKVGMIGIMVVGALGATVSVVLFVSSIPPHDVDTATPAVARTEAPEPKVKIPAEATQRDTVSVIDSLPPVDSLLPDTSLLSSREARLVERLWQPRNRMQHALVVNKADLQLRLLNSEEEGAWELQDTFRIATGQQRGRKRKAGDRRTPEGTYFIVGRKDDSELHERYGPLAYVLNYPNDEDQRAGRTGQGIWIHGTAPDSVPVSTRGCIEMHSNDLLELASVLKAGIGTPVVIVDDRKLSDPARLLEQHLLRKQRNLVLLQHRRMQLDLVEVLHQWRKAWESQDLEQYGHWYAEEDFHGQGLGWQAWCRRKQATFDRYATIQVSLNDIIVSDVSESTATVKFVQTYASNLAHMVNPKRLMFKKHDGLWKIYRESTIPAEELPL